MEYISPLVGPQFRPPELRPPMPLKGTAALKAMGWNKDMIDRRVAPTTDKRSYKVIDPYSSAALAADLATVLKGGAEAPGAFDDMSTIGSMYPKMPLGR